MQQPPNPTHPSVSRLRSVKIEQGKLNDQANTLADLAKVSREWPGWVTPQASRGWSGLLGDRGTFNKGQGPAPAEGWTALASTGQAGDIGKGCRVGNTSHQGTPALSARVHCDQRL